MQGALKILEHVKNTESPERFEETKAQLQGIAQIMSDGWTQGVDQFKARLEDTLSSPAPSVGAPGLVPIFR